MKTLIVLATLMFSALEAFASTAAIVPGDRIFIQARVLGCGNKPEIVEFGDVNSSGEVELFGDIRLSVTGATTDQVREMLTNALEGKTGRRPRSIKVIRVPEEDHKRATLFMMMIYEFRKRDCPQEPRLPDPELLDVWPVERLAQDNLSGTKSHFQVPVESYGTRFQID